MPLLELTNTVPIILLEIDSLSSSTHAIDKLYFSNTSFITEPGDPLSNIAFNPRLAGNLSISSDIFGGVADSLSSTILSTITLSNVDGELDSILVNYLVEGRDLLVKYGNKGDSYSTFTTVFTGILKSLTFTEDSITLQVSNYNSKLEVPLASKVYSPYGGSGYNTFNTSLHGKRLPVTYGVVKNITPHYIRNVLVGDTSNSTWDPYLTNLSTLSSDKLTATCTSLGTQSTFSRIGARNGSKRYIEFHTNFTGAAVVGIASPSALPTSASIGSSATGIGFSAEDGNILNASELSPYSSGYLGGSIIGVAIDGSSGSIWFSKNGTWIGDPANGTGAAYAGYLGDMLPGVTMSVEGDTVACRFTPPDLAYTAPEGFNIAEDTSVVVSQLAYKIHDADIFNVICVHSNGVDLDEELYVSDLTAGEFQVVVGSVGNTRITADIQGSTSPTPLDSAAAIITDLLSDRISGIDIDSNSIAELSTAYFAGESIINRASCGSYYSGGEQINTALEEYISSFSIQGGFTSTGTFKVNIFKGPVAIDSVLTLTKEHIEKISSSTINSPEYEKTVGYARNYTKFNPEGVASSVLYDNPDQYSFMLAEWRTASTSNSELGINNSTNQVEEVPEGLSAGYTTIQDRYLNSRKGKLVPSVIFSGIDALLEAKRRWRLSSSGEGLVPPTSYQVHLPFIISGLSLNNTIQLSYPRFGLSNELPVVITSTKLNLMNYSTVLTVWAGVSDAFTIGTDVDIDKLNEGFIEYLGCTPKEVEVVDLIPYGEADYPFGLATGSYAT